MSYKFPGCFISSSVTVFKTKTEPPKGLSANPNFGFSDLEDNPFPPKKLFEIGIEQIVNSLDVILYPSSGSLDISLGENFVRQMNYNQRYIISCNFLYSLEIFIGEPMDEKIKYHIKQKLSNILYNLTIFEKSPGVWDESS